MLPSPINTKFANTNTINPTPAESASSQCTGPVSVAKTGPAGAGSSIPIAPTSFAEGTAPQGLITVKQGDIGIASHSQSFMGEEQVTAGHFEYMPKNVTVADDVRLMGRTALKEPPETLSVGESIDFSNTHRETLPGRLFSMWIKFFGFNMLFPSEKAQAESGRVKF